MRGLRQARFIVLFLVAAGILSTFSACADSIAPPTDGIDTSAGRSPGRGSKSVASITITPDTFALAVGDSTMPVATALSRNGAPLTGVVISWASSDSTVARVSSAGGVLGMRGGTARITASSGGRTDTAFATIVARTAAVVSIAVTPNPASVTMGQTLQLVAQPRDSAGNVVAGSAVSWRSSDSTVARVGSTGIASGLRAGTVTVNATSGSASGGTSLTVTPAVAAVVSLNPASVGVAVGKTAQVTAVVQDASGDTLTGSPVAWTSTRPSVATVSSTGLVAGVTAGTAQVIAASGGKSDTAGVTVTTVPVASVVLTPASLSLVVGQSTQLSAATLDATGATLTGRVVTWSTSDSTIARVGSSGLVTGAGAGSARVVATSEGKADTAAVTVSLVPIATLTVTPSSVSLYPTQTAQLVATTKDAGGAVLTGRTVTWTSTATGVATVSSAGLVRAVATGSARVIATAEGKSDTTAVSVSAVPVATVSVSPASASLTVGQSVQLTATARDSAGNVLTGRPVSWSSGNPGAASVTSLGVATGVAAGSASIVATVSSVQGASAVSVSGTSGSPTPRVGWYVAPNGSGGGSGSASSPWDLATALSGSRSIAPGDTIWVRGGTYSGEFVNWLNGTSSAPIVIRQYPGERATIDGDLVVMGSYVTFWGLEVMRSNPFSSSSLGINVKAPGSRFINLVVHDESASGLGVWTEAPDAEVYGSIIYNNGTHQNLDHGIYAQGLSGTKQIRDNVIFNNLAYGLHIYTGSGGYIQNFQVDGNVSFNNGTIGIYLQAPDLFIGGSTPAAGISFTNNSTWRSNTTETTATFGYAGGAQNQDLTMQGNTFVGAMDMADWSTVQSSGNAFYAAGQVINLIGSLGGYSWSGNSFYRDATAAAWGRSGTLYSLAGWRSATGLGSSDSDPGSRPASTRVIVRPNRYEAGRANIIVYNWANQGSVSADLSNVLQVGDRYEVRNVQNFFGAPVVSGTYGGGAITIPITAVTPPAPIGRSTQPPPSTGTAFQVFVVLKPS